MFDGGISVFYAVKNVRNEAFEWKLAFFVHLEKVSSAQSSRESSTYRGNPMHRGCFGAGIGRFKGFVANHFFHVARKCRPEFDKSFDSA